MCTVFAESEVISHIGAGEKREDIASGVISSVAERVANLCKRHGVGNEVFLTGGLSGMPYFIEHPPLRDDFLNVIMGGLLCGTGLGLVYSANGSTGGTDIIGFVITKYYSISIARILLVVDVCIVLSSFFILERQDNSLEKTIYGLILLPLMWQMVEIVINGARQSVQLFIFSKHYDEIANHINSELKRGCTIIDGIGWYSKSSQKIVIVIARRTEATSIFRLVRTIDPAAFVTKTNVMGVYGNGFDKLK